MMDAARISAPTRLHFGLLPLPTPPRQGAYGGLGAMIESPRVEVAATPTADWEFCGTLADRARRDIEAMQVRLGKLSSARIAANGPPEHAGLGVGTALGLSLAKLFAPEHSDPAELMGRGRRSRIGIMGFQHGGFWFDDGEHTQQLPWPESWRFVLLHAESGSEWHGERELDAFNRPRLAASDSNSRLQDRCIKVLIPAIRNADFPTFASALGEYGLLAGEPFRAAQGGPYASPSIQSKVEMLAALGFSGAGQSSWGPTVYVPVPGESTGRDLVRQLTDAGERCECVRVAADGAIQLKMA